MVVFIDFVGIKKAGFAVEIISKGIIGLGNVFLHGAMGEQKVREQGKQRVQQRADDDEQRVEIGRGVRVVGERGVDGNGKRAKRNGAIARARCAKQGEHKRNGGERDGQGDGVVKRELHRKGADGKRYHGKHHVFKLACEPVVQIHQAAGDDAEDERGEILLLVEPPNKIGAQARAD